MDNLIHSLIIFGVFAIGSISGRLYQYYYEQKPKMEKLKQDKSELNSNGGKNGNRRNN